MSKITLKKPKTLWFKTFLILIAGGILILSLFGIMYTQIVHIMTEKTNSLFENTVYQVAQRCEQQVEQMEKMILGISENQWIKNYLSNLEEGKDTYQMTNVRVVREVLRERNVNLADNIYVFTESYAPINCYYSTPVFSTDAKYKTYIEKYVNFSDNILWRVTNKEPYTLEAISYIHDGMEVYGLLVVQFSESVFGEIFTSGNDDGHEEMLLKSETNRILYGNATEKLGTLYGEEVEKRADYTVSYSINHFGWKLSGILDSSAVTRDLKEIIPMLIGVFLCISILVIAISITIFHSFLRPINQIIYGMEKIQGGDLEFEMTREKDDEFGVIVDNFNGMLERIRELLRAVQEQKNNYYRLEMLALKAKLNPHFLYNAFDLIYWKLVLKNEYEIADVVVNLADILRYSVNHKKELVSVKEDMQYISSYLSFQNLLLNNKLDYTIDILDEIKKYEIPKMLLQPLVENAIKYGINEQGGKIEITGRLEGDNIVFCVKDYGKGISEELCERLMNGRGDRGGFGIRLVKSIVKTTYGDECGVIVESTQGRGTCITVQIKKIVPSIQKNNGI